MKTRRGPELPYSVVGGVTPWGRRWLVASAKMHGATFAPEEPRVYDSFRAVVDDRPSFSALVVNAPIGYRDLPSDGPRTCDQLARELLGLRRGSAVRNAPSYLAIEHNLSWHESGLDAITMTLLPRYRELANEMSPFRQRVVFEGQPELSFFHLNEDQPLLRSKMSDAGYEERRSLLERKIQGISRIFEVEIEDLPRKHLVDAAALMWTARRVFGHAARRIPVDPEWDSRGLRVEIVY